MILQSERAVKQFTDFARDFSAAGENMNLLSKASLFLFLLMASTLLQAQTCYDDIEQSTPNSRYTLRAGGSEVFDSTTQLIWKRCPEGSSGDSCDEGIKGRYTWSQALNLSDSTWRLPNIKELASLIEAACDRPTINLMIFPATPNFFFWSSSSFARDGDSVWIVNFEEGYDSARSKYGVYYVRLVRGG